MPVPVVAKNDLDAYILETTIVVKIPRGTEGHLVQEIRKDVVIVQFDVPSLAPLRVNKRDLIMSDSIDYIASELERIIKIEPFIERDVHRAADDLLLRALESISNEENEAQVQKIVRLFREISKHY